MLQCWNVIYREEELLRRSFTLIEVIIVLILLGILANFGTDIIFNLYNNYILSQRATEAHYATQSALDIIEKKYLYRLPVSCIARKGTSGSDFDDIKTLKSIMPGESYIVLECINYADEARRGLYDSSKHFYTPGWSGFIDLDSASTSKSNKTLATPGSKLSFAEDIIKALSEDKCDLSKQESNVGVVFDAVVPPPNVDAIDAMGWRLYKDPSKKSDLHVYEVYKKDDTTLGVHGTFPDEVADIYYLVYTAYALVPEKRADGSYSLYLYYNYQPWKGETYKDGKKTLLLRYLQTFAFQQKDQAIAIKLCGYQPVKDEYNITFCSERVIL